MTHQDPNPRRNGPSLSQNKNIRLLRSKIENNVPLLDGVVEVDEMVMGSDGRRPELKDELFEKIIKRHLPSRERLERRDEARLLPRPRVRPRDGRAKFFVGRFLTSEFAKKTDY